MYILATSSNWFSKLVRQFFFLLDSIIYGAISKIYDLLITIARTSPLSQADILDMADRIYKLLAIFMVFKVTFSLIMYVVNPDDFSDKNKGVSKLGMNIVVSLSMLILTPYIFSYAYQLQTYILEDNSLATLIFGTSTKKEFFNTAGDDMAYMAMSPFFVPDDSFHELNACSNLTIEEGTGNDKKIVFNPQCSGLNNDSDLTAKGGEYETTTSLLKFTKDNNQFTVDNLRVYVKGVNSKNVGLTFRQELATATDPETKEFIMDYSFIFSSVVGVIIVLLLVTYCMDIALRSIKLAFLQLIAPIPIISYVDPKSGKDGLFKKWYQMCFKTYLSLFIRLIALYFAVYIISRVSEMHLVDVIDGSFQTNAFVAIFIIIGALMFAKQLPKILEGLGVKLDGGGFTLNPLKKMEKEALGGKQILGATKGFAAGAMVGTAGALTGAGLGRGITSALSGMSSGIKGKKFGEIRKDQVTKNAEMRRAIASGSTFWGRKNAQISGFFGTPGTLGKIEHDKIAIQNRIDDYEAQKKVVQDRIAPKKVVISKQQAVKSSIEGMESFTTGLIEGGKAGEYSRTYKRIATDHDYLTNNVGQIADHDVLDANNNLVVSKGTVISGSHAALMNGEKERYSKKVGRSALMDEMLTKSGEELKGTVGQGDYDDFQAQFRAYSKDVEILNDAIGEYESSASPDDIQLERVEVETGFSKIHDQAGNLGTASKDVQTSIKDQETEIEEYDRKIQSENVELQSLNAQEKTAKSNAEVTHAAQGGPANPRSIRPASSTSAPRSGGPGSGTGPNGFVPGGPGPQGPQGPQ